MPQPTASQVHVDAMLTNVSVAYRQDQSGFIANQVFPVVPVDHMSDKYWVYNKNDWMRDEVQKRGDTDESVGSGYNLSQGTYFADVWAFHKDVGDLARANSDAAIDLDRDAVEFVTQRFLIRQEVQFVSDYMKTGVWATDKTGGSDFTQWDNYASSDPVEDIENGKEAILAVTGYLPNTLVIGYQTWRKLKNHPDFVDRIKYTSAEAVSLDIVARYMEVDRILVARSIRATNVEGETAAYQFNFGKGALLTYVAPNPGPLTPSAGYTFLWRGVSEGLGANIGIKRIRMEWKNTDRIEGQMAWDNKIIGADLGYFMADAVA